MSSSSPLSSTNDQVLAKLGDLYRELFAHDGYGDLRVEIKLMKAGQKEVIIHCGKQFRFRVDFKNEWRSPSASNNEVHGRNSN
ncbi:hypothetical protein MK489_19015 [Myxococcota bacterium]|nr:hypothetical protein [Myxococcota bacterium]